MPEKSKWKNKCFNTSFDDPTRNCEKTKNEPRQQPTGILSILGKNIGLLSRKHNRLAQRKYQPGPGAEKTDSKIKISNLLKFPKTKENKINSSPAQTNPGDKKKISSASDNSQTRRTTKRGKSSKSKESSNEFNGDKTTACDELKCKTKNSSGQKKKFRQQEVQKSNNTKSNTIEQKLQKSKIIRKSKSDSALNDKKRRPLSATSAQSNGSTRPSSGSGSATTRTSSSSYSSSKSVTKKPKKPVEKTKKKEESSSLLTDQPVVYVNYRYQV